MDDDGILQQTIPTQKGPHKVKRLMFGFKVAPIVFQRCMDQTLQGLDGVTCFFDDILARRCNKHWNASAQFWIAYVVKIFTLTKLNANFLVNSYVTWGTRSMEMGYIH
jgi:hypothetical protein